jgi:hypothetical protein
MRMQKIGGIVVACVAGASAMGHVSAFAQSEIRNQQNSMTLVGCLMSETDYRKAHGLGKGAIGGLGLGDEFVLVNATEPSTAQTTGSSTSARCTETGSGKAYRLTGQSEEKLKPFVGRRIEVTGAFDHARDAKTAAGETKATLPPEIKIASFREAPAFTGSATASANPAPAAPQTSPAPASVEARNETPARGGLPHTASNLPLVGLIGLMSLSAALGLRLLSPRAS